jgi:tripartite-type tricarboxylate transporter receptor subunit TctC
MVRMLTATALAAAITLATPAQAQDWPTRPITMVVPFGAGGAVDSMARIIAPRLSQILGQQVIIENIGGAGGMAGAARIAKAPPDGYAFIYGNTGTHAFNQTLYKKPQYNAVTDFAPVSVTAHAFFTLIARKDLPATTLPEFIAYARENQAHMQFASAGAGSGTHIVCVLLNMAMGTNVAHVPYRSTAIAMQDMMAGRIDYICEPIITAIPQIAGGTVKAIAFLGARRSPALPDLATAAEQGLSGLAVSAWNAMFFPKGTPPAIVKRLAEAASETIDTPSVRERIESLGYGVAPREQRGPEFLAKFLPEEIERWAGPIKASGVSMD